MTELAEQAKAAFAARNWAKAFAGARDAIAAGGETAGLLKLATLAALAQSAAGDALPYAQAWDRLAPTVEAKFALQDVYWKLKQRDALLTVSREVAALAPNDPNAWFRLGQAATPFDAREAADSFQRCFMLRPTDSLAIRGWFNLVFAHSTNTEMVAALRAMIAMQLPVAGDCMAQRYLAISEERLACEPLEQRATAAWSDLGFKAAATTHMRWRALARTWWAADPTDVDAAENFILASLAGHDLTTLDAAVAVVHAHTPGNVIGTYITNPDDFEALDAHWDVAFDAFPETRVLAQSFTAAPRAFFFGCDQAYFNTFGAALMDSFLRRAPHLALHVHVINPDEARLRALFDAAPPGALLRITVEQVDPAETAIPAYAHAARFVRFVQVLDAYPDQLWMMDADSICQRDPSWLCDRLETGIAVTLLPGRIESHNMIAAGLVGIGPSAPARRYARLVAAYIAHAFADSRLAWGCDQAALYLALLYLRKIGAAPEIVGLPAVAMEKTEAATFFIAK